MGRPSKAMLLEREAAKTATLERGSRPVPAKAQAETYDWPPCPQGCRNGAQATGASACCPVGHRFCLVCMRPESHPVDGNYTRCPVCWHNLRYGGQRGQALVEYALILLLIVIVSWAALALFGSSLAGIFSHLTAGL